MQVVFVVHNIYESTKCISPVARTTNYIINCHGNSLISNYK